ncbi:MAG: fibronectin type III domain-containing protein [Candidatus Acidiferrales bacterium]
MELQKPEEAGGKPARKVAAPSISYFFLVILIGALFVAGCAAPGQPVTRRPPAPAAITDLSTHQFGNRIELTFTLPKQTVQGRALTQLPQVEIYREYISARAANGTNIQLPAPQHLTVTVPSQMVNAYREGDLIRFSDHLAAPDIRAHAGDRLIYMVRTRISKRDSADSNLAILRVFPAPEPISDLQAQVTKSAIELLWTAPAMPEAGAPRPISIRYRIYRSNNVSTPLPALITNANPGGSGTAGSLLFGQVAKISSPPYRDANFKFGEAYAYYVVSVAQYKSAAVESESSKIIEVTPRDTFPPSAPTSLVAAFSPANASAPLHVDLSWAISPETEVAGYNVYRSAAESGPPNRWDRLNRSLLLTPVFHDIPVVPGQRYFYRVTAVDRFGNESAPSAPIGVSVPATNE